MIINSPIMSMKAVAIRANSLGGIFLTSCARMKRRPAAMAPPTMRTAGCCSDCPISSCAKRYSLTLPSADGGVARPTTPATATMVRM